MAEEAPKLEQLFTERKVGEYVLREWSLGQLVELSPVFDTVATECRKRGLTLDAVQRDPLKLLTLITPLVPKVLAVTMGKSEEDVRAMPGHIAQVLALTAMEMNLAYLKNLFGPVMAALVAETVREEETGASSGPSST